MTLAQLLFSFSGRVSRLPFWLFNIAVVAIILGPSFFYSGSPHDQAHGYVAIVYLVCLWPMLAVQTKRWHDRDKSGWWILINLVPVLGPLWALVENGFLAGTPGPNRFGSNEA